MTETQRLPTGANDAELISRVRGGDVDAYGELFSRHVDAATRLARALAGSADADDLVSESFVKVLNVLLGGGGPDIAFRAYLLTAVRRLHVDKIRATRRSTPTDDLTPYDPGIPFHDTVISGFEGGAAARAFASLPERWQMVLWHLEVEGQKPADVAPLLGMSANSVSALAYRAREGLRQAFLQMHTADLVDDNCRWTHDKIGAYVRTGLSRRDHDKVERHLDECRRCTAIYLELAELNTSLAAVIGPLVLGGAAAAYLTGTAAGASGLLGMGALLGRVRDVVVGNSQAAIAVGAAAGLAGVATAGFLVMQGHSKHDALVVSDPSLSAPGSSTASSPASRALRHHRSASEPGRQQRPGSDRPTGRTTAGGSLTPSALVTGSSNAAAQQSLAPGATAGSTTTAGTATGLPAGQPTSARPSTPGSPKPTRAPTSAPPSFPTASSPPPTHKPPASQPPPAPAPADLRVDGDISTVFGQGFKRVSSTVTASVSGFGPAGGSTTVTITPAKGFQVEVEPPDGCTTVSVGTVTCRVDAGAPSRTLTYLHPGQSLVLTFSIPRTYTLEGRQVTDPDAGNNSCSWDPRAQRCD
jgi:RNA polymerase sigma factor (sigma-70 family)